MVWILHGLGWNVSPQFLEVLLPVGISFYTFQSMSYNIDVYHGRMAPCRDFWDFSLYVSFFPQLLAGPIERAGNLLGQFAKPRVLQWHHITSGVWLFLQGCFLKAVVADNLKVIADVAFATETVRGPTALLGMYAFTFQIYCDFAGYSLMARGIAQLMGIELTVNFRQPYFSAGAREFWRRWHISLSTWLRDYLYISLGGNQRGASRTLINLMLTMLLGGLWHGAAWRFVIWGAFHGALLAVSHIFAKEHSKTADGPNPLRLLLIPIFFHITCFGWLIFRCDSLAQIVQFPITIIRDFSWSYSDLDTLLLILVLVAPVILMDIAGEYWGTLRARMENIVSQMPFLGRLTLGALFLLLLLFLIVSIFFCGMRNGSQFIYFQF